MSEIQYYEKYFEARGVEVEVIDLNDPPAWMMGQDPERCDTCGALLEDTYCSACDEEGAYDTDLEIEAEDTWMDEGAW